ncbi:MAG: DUF362 domain-containing protein [Candidatus Eisenbacteria bacterium]|uniref:DUF362 domain-containing protein n=1 Tax=Eiseniibacteriota bacterium TaxID=2212470 RepID=A0A956SGF5_UNCEI|nr:DUF362 domain-containing protein [Candidatus Eisenbacteria bacterium]MCB9464004.1 DUF362 domain-containing protein [Candidatus Eisenbacteria bacterium]
MIAAVGDAMEAARFRDFIPEGTEVCLKPNLGWDLFLPGAVTSPLVVEGVVRKLQGYVSKLYMVEADQVLVDIEKSFRQTRMDRICERYGIEWVNLSKTPFVQVPVPNALEVESIPLPEILTRTTLVTIPVMKTHGKTVLTGAIKNQWGCLPTFRHNYHPVVNEVLRDLTSVLRPAFAVMDATVALEGNGPKSGRPRICNLVLASGDPVAIDTIAGEVMGLLGRFEVPHLQYCAEAGLGVHDRNAIDVLDSDRQPRETPRFDFQTAEHNAVSWVETVLRKTGIRKLVFETKLLDVMCWGAKVWYFIWYYLVKGRRLRDTAISESPYGAQWTKDEPR